VIIKILATEKLEKKENKKRKKRKKENFYGDLEEELIV